QARALVAAACRAGDVFRCADAEARGRVAALLAEECRGGGRDRCFEAATDPGDEAAFARLMGPPCGARAGRARRARATRKLAGGAADASLIDLWRGACADAELQGTPDDVTARADACARWSKLATDRRDVARAAAVTAAYCAGATGSSCIVAADLYDRIGAQARALPLLERRCAASEDAPECAEVARRLALGLGGAAPGAPGPARPRA